MLRHQVNVELGERRYPIHIGHDLHDDLQVLGVGDSKRPAVLVTNRTIEPLHGQRWRDALARSATVSAQLVQVLALSLTGQAPRTICLLPPANLFSTVLSPDGKWLAWGAPRDGVMNIWVAPRSDPSQAKPLTSEKTRPIRSFFWSPDSSSISPRSAPMELGGEEYVPVIANRGSRSPPLAAHAFTKDPRTSWSPITSLRGEKRTISAISS